MLDAGTTILDSGFCHIELGVVQRRKGHSALARFAYQVSTYVNYGGRRADYSRYSGEHQGGLILVPEGGAAEFADMGNLVRAAGFRETRVDAQEGRTVDFGLPRAVPAELLQPLAAFALAEFAARGMVVRLDIECPGASDGGLNPHAHAWLSQRILEHDGFGKKEPQWNSLFLRSLGRYVRALIAGRLTLGCALLGVAAYVDPRRNDARGLSEPEERFPAKAWRMHDRGVYVPGIEALKETREANRVAAKAAGHSDGQKNQTSHITAVRNAVSSRHPPSDEVRQTRVNLVVALAAEDGIEARGPKADGPGIELTTGGGLLFFNGDQFTVEGVAGSKRAQVIAKLARALDWPAIIVEGDVQSTDDIIVAGALYGVTAINTCASENALRLIKQKYGRLLADTVRPLDPLLVTDQLLATYAHSQSPEVEDAPQVRSQNYEPATDKEVLASSVEQSDWQEEDAPWKDDPDDTAPDEMDEENAPWQDDPEDALRAEFDEEEADSPWEEDGMPEPDPSDT